MAWSTPPTAAAGSVFTASIWNTGVRDNLNMNAAAISTTSGWLITTSAAHTLAQREVDETINDTAGTTTSTSFTATLSGGGTSPAVTVTTGIKALIFLTAAVANAATNNSYASYAVSGATTSAAIDGRSIVMDGGSGKDDRIGVTNFFDGLTPGSNTFTMQYRVSASTGTYQKRRVLVMAL